MKKHVMLALLILFLGSSFVFAGAFGAGVSAGGSMAFVGTEPSGDGTPRYGFTGGVFGEYDFYAIENIVDFSAQTGVYFMMNGFRSDVNLVGAPGPSPFTEETPTNFNLNYIQVPVLLKASFPLNLPVKPFALVGASAGYLITKSVEASDDLSEAEDGYFTAAVSDPYEDKLSNFDFGLVFGAGVDLDMGLSIDARFNLGLMNIDEDASGDDYTKNRSITLMVSYNIL
ncbi:MAG: porin family protein [Sphaerochaetaceae bacterium]